MILTLCEGIVMRKPWVALFMVKQLLAMQWEQESIFYC